MTRIEENSLSFAVVNSIRGVSRNLLKMVELELKYGKEIQLA